MLEVGNFRFEFFGSRSALIRIQPTEILDIHTQFRSRIKFDLLARFGSRLQLPDPAPDLNSLTEWPKNRLVFSYPASNAHPCF